MHFILFQKGSESLVDSIKNTTDQIKTLKVVGQRLNANLKDKEAGASVDCALLRRRRALSNHKWVPIRYVKDTSSSSNKLVLSSAPPQATAPVVQETTASINNATNS